MKSKIAKLGITFALVCTMCSGVLVTSNVGNAFEVSGNEVQAANVSAVQAAAQAVSANSSNVSAQEGESVATSSNSNGEAEYATDHILIMFDDAQDGQYHAQAVQAKSLLQQQGFNVTKTISEASEQSGSIAKVDVPENTSIDAAIEQAKATSGVSHAQPDYIYRLLENSSTQTSASNTVLQNTTKAQTIPNDPATQIYDPTAAENQYYLYGSVYNGESLVTKGANVFDAWDVVKCNYNTTVAVFDTGVNLLHEDLQDTLLKDYAYDAYNEKKLEASGTFNGDYAGHGSHVCGIVGAVANNGIGLAGSSYNANVLPVKVFTDDSTNPGAYDSDIVEAYEYVFKLMDAGSVQNLHVINMSLGGYGSASSVDRAVETKIQEAKTRNIITVCAGGNGSSSGTPYTKSQYPSDFDDAFSVTALDTNGTNAVWSDYNMQKNISAPGVKIYSSVNTSSSSYARYSGTSMASPLVAGIAALLWSADSEATVDEVWSAITSTADAIDDPTDAYSRWPDKTGSKGAINAKKAVMKILGAYITAPDDFTSLLRSESVQLTAKILDVDEELNWQWSIENGTGSATITQDGLVTGVSAGSVNVTAKTTYNGREYSAQISLTIDDIALKENPTATKGYANAVTVSWVGVKAANSYLVQRTQQGVSGFTTIATISGAKGQNLSYADTSAETATTYTYRIVPIGSLDGETIEGKASQAVTGVRFDMTTSYATQMSMCDALSSHMSVDNKSVDTVIIVAESDTTSLITASGLAGTYQAPILTVEAGSSELSSDVAQTLNKLTPLRILILGNENTVTSSLADQISEKAPFASVARYSETVANKLAEKLYRLGSSNASWGSTAFIISSDAAQSEKAASLTSYAYSAKAPVFTTNESGDVSVTTRQNLIAGAFKRIVIVGDTNAVSEAVENKLNSYGISTERISASDVYSLSAAIATDGLEQNVFDGSGFAFVKANTSVAAQAAALSGYTSMPLLVVSDRNEESTSAIPSLASLLANSAQSTTSSRVISFFDGSNPISTTEKERLQKIVDGQEVEPLVQASVSRLAGEDQVETSVKISGEGFKTAENVVIARSDDFRDAMSSTGLAGALNAPILLTDTQQLSASAKTEIERLGAKNVYIIGGTGAIKQEVEDALNNTECVEKVQRVYGDAAYDTAVECAKKLIEVDSAATTRAIVATSYTFEDALSISSFAYKYHVPIFLQTLGAQSSNNAIPESGVNLLTGTGAFANATVYVPGGPGAVSNESLTCLSRGEEKLVRLYEGEDAYDTSVAIAKYMINNKLLDASTVTFASGAKGPGGVDALAGSALAGLKGGVLLLVNDVESFGDVNTNALTDVLKPNVASVNTAYILGGTSVMPEAFLNKVKEVMGL